MLSYSVHFIISFNYMGASEERWSILKAHITKFLKSNLYSIIHGLHKIQWMQIREQIYNLMKPALKAKNSIVRYFDTIYSCFPLLVLDYLDLMHYRSRYSRVTMSEFNRLSGLDLET